MYAKTGMKELEETIDIITHCRANWLKMEEKAQKHPTRKVNTESKASSKTLSAGGATPKRDKSLLEGKESGDSQLSEDKREASSPAEARTEKMKKEVETSEAWTEVRNKKKNRARKVKIGEAPEVSDKRGVDSTPILYGKKGNYRNHV